jgi:ketosteroid isomerase-like protein
MWKYLWVLAPGVALTGFLVWFFVFSVRGTPPPPAPGQGGQAPQTHTQADPGEPAERQVPAVPAESAASVQSQLTQVLAKIKEANQKKDLSQLLSHYSPNFAQLTQRAQSISKNWKIYDYPKMEFEIQEIKLQPDQTALARVTWEVEARNISTQKHKTIVKTYLVKFVRESGQWRIKAMDNAE